MINFLSEFKSYLPVVFFVAGVGGSLHCVGMCGGLVTASCANPADVFRYQIGRLIGYLFLGALAGVVGSMFNLAILPVEYSVVPSLVIGMMFIWWGLQNYMGKRAEIPTPKFLRKLYSILWPRLVYKNKTFTKAFFTGLISIFLPCGLLYGVILGTVALQHPFDAVVSVFFFWLGTVPSMVLAPSVIQRFLRPLKARLPKTYAVSLVTIGLLTISFRLEKIHKKHLNESATSVEQTKNHSCH